MSKPKHPNIHPYHRDRAKNLLKSRREVDPKTHCWKWTGNISNKGYGVVSFNGKVYFVHRLSWNAWRGDIPESKTIDHLCANRACFNPRHIEPVSNLLNNRRAHGGTAPETACIKGHEFTEATSYFNRRGRRICKLCEAQRSRERRQRGELCTWDKTGTKLTPVWERRVRMLKRAQAHTAKIIDAMDPGARSPGSRRADVEPSRCCEGG